MHHMILNFDKRLSSTAAETPVKIKNNPPSRYVDLVLSFYKFCLENISFSPSDTVPEYGMTPEDHPNAIYRYRQAPGFGSKSSLVYE